jgi:8-oxo-dGTP pyrophosphatase MutT (NUDIX family)
MHGSRDEVVNVYDASGAVVGARPRGEAKRAGLTLGAVHALIVNGRAGVLLQRRRADKENGGLWDKSVGGHVSAGEEFDDCVVREAGEELFDDAGCGRVRLARSDQELAALVGGAGPARGVALRRVAFQTGLRDVRRAPGGGLRVALYHVAVYLGWSDAAAADFVPQPSEIDELRYFPAADVDRLFLDGGLAPNMGFLWLTQGQALLGLAARRGHR